MPIINKEIPDALKILLPEDHVEKVIIGKTCYEMAPLTAGSAEIVLKELVEILVRSFSELLKVAEQPGGNSKSVEDVATLTQALKKGLESIVADGKVIRIVSVVLDLEEEVIRKEATIKQLHYIIGLLWKQNFDMSDLSDDARKNFDGLLVALSLKNRDDIVYQWADYALRVLPSPAAGSLKERIVLVMQLASDLSMVEKAEVEKFIQSKESTPILPITQDSAESTLTEKEKSSVQ